MKIYALERFENDTPLINASLLKTVKPHTTPVITATGDGTGTLLATGGADGVIKVWDIKGGYVTHTFRGHAGVITALHFFEVPAIENSNITNSNKKRRSKSDLAQDDSMTIGHDSGASFRLASGSEDGKIRIWDLAKRKSVATLDSHVSVVRSLDYSADSHTLVSASRDKTAIVWDARTWKSKKVMPILESVEAAGLLEEGTLIYAGGEQGRLRIWNVETGREVTEEQEAGGEGDGIVHILHNPSQRFLVSVHADQSLILHSTASLLKTPSDMLIEPLPILRRISGTHDEIIDLAYVTPDRSLLALATNSENIRLVSLASSKSNSPSATSASYFGADVALLEGHEDIIICLSVDWSGCWLATGAKDNTARLWRIDHASSSYQLYATFTGHAESIGAISLPSSAPPQNSPENSLEHTPPFLLTGSQDRTIKRWNIPKTSSSSSSSSRALYTRKAHDKDINAIALSPTSSLFASASQDRTVKIWSTEEGEVQGILRGHRRGVWSVAFAPKDTPPISGDNGPASSNRGLVLTGSGDKTVKIWSLNDYSCLRTLEGHTNSVLKVLWLPTPPPPQPPTPDAATTTSPKRAPLIASAGGDGLVKVWDASTGDAAATLDNHTDRIWALTADPTTGTLVSGGGDSVVTFWADTSVQTAARTTAAASQRVEQDQELQNHIHDANYRDAITLALALNHPARLLALFQSVTTQHPPEAGSISGLHAVDAVLASLSDEQLLSLLARVRDWNTNARTCAVAQRVLGVVVRSYDRERLAALGRRSGKGGGGREVWGALRAYTERHYRRVEELWGESWLVDVLLGEMEQLGGGVGDLAGGEDVVGGKGGGEDVVMVG